MLEFGDRKIVCDECPMIWGLDRQMKSAVEYGTKPQIEYCGCDKTGDGKFYMYGFCSEAFVKEEKEPHSNPRRTGRAYRRAQARRKNKKRRQTIEKYACSPSAGYLKHDFVDGEWKVVGTHIQYPHSSNRQKFLKRESNRKVRRYTKSISAGGGYRKLFDYWWNLY